MMEEDKKTFTYTTTDIANLFGISSTTTLKYLRLNNIKNITKKHFTYKNIIYFWNPLYITEECFKQLNRKQKLYVDLYDFHEKSKTKIDYNIKDIQAENKKNEYLKKMNIELSNKYSERWFSNESNYILHLGPTNSGKTYNAIESLKKSNSGLYLSPLRLLAHEIYDKLISEGINCNLKTGEESIDNNSNITSQTIEMANLDEHYDCIVIDESFMISDENRGKFWLNAILYSKAKEIHIISNMESENIISEILNKTNKKYIKNYYERKTKLIMSDKPFSKVRDYNKTAFIYFSRIECLIEKNRLENRGYKVSIVYGNLPPEIKKEQIDLFVNGTNDIIISTDAIGMGLNLPCDNIVFNQIKKFDGIEVRNLNSTEVKQIAGRAGRYGYSEYGTVYGYDKNMNEFIRSRMTSNLIINKKAYYGIDLEILKLLKGKSLKNKLKLYGELDLIPDNLKDYITMESPHKYLDIISRCENIEKLNIESAWKIINLPFGNNYANINEYIFCVITNVKFYMREETINIVDVNILNEAENYVREIDVMINFSNHFPHLIDIDNFERVKEIKQTTIDSITNFLLNKKLSSTKLCVNCGKNVGIKYKHKLCEECYEERYYYKNYY